MSLRFFALKVNLDKPIMSVPCLEHRRAMCVVLLWIKQTYKYSWSSFLLSPMCDFPQPLVLEQVALPDALWQWTNVWKLSQLISCRWRLDKNMLAVPSPCSVRVRSRLWQSANTKPITPVKDDALFWRKCSSRWENNLIEILFEFDISNWRKANKL